VAQISSDLIDHYHTAIFLFSGCGGATLGISQADYNVRVAVEWEKAACGTLRGTAILATEEFEAYAEKCRQWASGA
jgi:site-specific DNA-cytosine methylase